VTEPVEWSTDGDELARLPPALGGMAPANARDANLKYLAGAAGPAVDRVRSLVASARLGAGAGLRPDVVYARHRAGPVAV
jgi:hypothetical protein